MGNEYVSVYLLLLCWAPWYSSDCARVEPQHLKLFPSCGGVGGPAQVFTQKTMVIASHINSHYLYCKIYFLHFLNKERISHHKREVG